MNSRERLFGRAVFSCSVILIFKLLPVDQCRQCTVGQSSTSQPIGMRIHFRFVTVHGDVAPSRAYEIRFSRIRASTSILILFSLAICLITPEERRILVGEP